MFCGKCGASLPDGAGFCPNCGNPVAFQSQAIPSEPVAPVEPVTPVEPVAPVEPVQSIPFTAPAQSIPVQPEQTANGNVYAQPAENTYPNPYASAAAVNAPKPKKVKSGKKKIAPIIICVVLAVIVAAGVAAACMWQSIARSALGELGFYAWRESKTVEKTFGIDNYEKLFENKAVTSKSSVKASSNQDEFDKIFDALSADVLLAFSREDEKALAVVDLKAEDDVKLTANISLDKDKLGVSIPDLTDEKFYADLSDMGVEEEGIELDYDTISKELVKIYKQIDKDHIKTNTVVTKEKIDGKKCRKVSFTFDGDKAADFIVDLLTAVKDDDALLDALDPALEASYNAYVKTGGDDEYTYKEFKEEALDHFDNAVKMIRETFKDADDIELVLSYATDSKGNVVNRSVIANYDGEETFRFNIDTAFKGKTVDATISVIVDDITTEITVNRTNSSNGAVIEIDGKTVDEDKDGYVYSAKFEDIRVESIGGVNVLLGSVNVKGNPVDEGKEDDSYDNFDIKIDLVNSETYDINAKVEFEDVEFEAEIKSELSSEADFSKFETPDKKGLTDIEEFLESMEEKLEEKGEEIFKDIDPDLFLSISKNAQLKQCQSNERIIKSNLGTYILTGNNGKAFKNVNDVLAKQAAFDKMFDEGHPPYCKNGRTDDGVKYSITVDSDLTYNVKCRNPKCPNYGN